MRGDNLSLFSPVRFWPLGGVSAAVYCISFSRNPKNCKGQVAFWGVLLAGSYSGTIHLLLSDVVMPKMNGQELATQIRVLYLQIKCLCMSGYTADVVSLRGILDKDMQFIQKPLSMQVLARTVYKMLYEVDAVSRGT